MVCVDYVPPPTPSHLNANQEAAGCTIMPAVAPSSQTEWKPAMAGSPAILACPSPGTGRCWKKGHNPWKGQPAEAIDVGNGYMWEKGGVMYGKPMDPNEGHFERCG